MQLLLIQYVFVPFLLMVQMGQGQVAIQQNWNNNRGKNRVPPRLRKSDKLESRSKVIKKEEYDMTITPDHRTLNDVAFNKCPPIGNAYRQSDLYVDGVHHELFPLMRYNYPISGTTARMIQDQTKADSPMTPGDYMLKGDEAEKYCGFLEPPHYPSSNPFDPFWHELRKVVDFQYARIHKVHPSNLSTWPKLWKSYDLEQIAAAVKNEFPNSEQAGQLDDFLKNGGIKMDHTVMNYRSYRDAVGLVFTLSTINAWVISAVSPITFLCKWTNGVPRPEEIAYLIAKGKFTTADGVPHDLVYKIKRLHLKNAFDFTAYKDQGSPTHPSWPAMHSSGSTLSLWLPVVAKLTAEQYCEALRMDLAVAHARIVAGVHYYQDNFAGLQLGMNVLYETLPKYLADNYYADEARVRHKLNHLMFDWKDFDPKRCTIGGVPVGRRLPK